MYDLIKNIKYYYFSARSGLEVKVAVDCFEQTEHNMETSLTEH